MIENFPKGLLVQRILAGTLLVALAVLCYQIIEFFIIPALWAAIIAYTTFPIYNFFQTKARFSANLSAFTMTACISLIVGVPLVIGIILLHEEALDLYSALLHRIKYGYVTVPQIISDLPIIGPQIQEFLIEVNKDSDRALLQIKEWVQSHLYYGKVAVDVLLGAIAKLGMVFMILFFFYRDGTVLINQIRQALRNIIGNRIDGYINSVGATTQAVVYGIGLTAVGQSLLSGVGYYFADAPNPLLLMILTFIVSLIPFGTPFVWGGVSIWLMSQGYATESIGLALWGICVVSWVDNLIRPIVISGATQIPFIIIFIGVLGGLSAFGFVGLFIGPVVLAIVLAVWREWISKQRISSKKRTEPEQVETSDKKKCSLLSSISKVNP